MSIGVMILSLDATVKVKTELSLVMGIVSGLDGGVSRDTVYVVALDEVAVGGNTH